MSVSGNAARSERSFGLSVGGACLVIGAASLWRGRMRLAEIAGGVGAALVLAGLLYPILLRTPSRLWWKLSYAIGWFNTRVLLSVVFVLILVPIGVWWRLRGKDPLSRRRQNWSGWSPCPVRYRDKQHYAKMY